ncbi:MAG: hypothetical protein EBU90_24625 [Proteobacteria bacterium]|nr:hypothetical protein [Pseudomonadota bacterium]
MKNIEFNERLQEEIQSSVDEIAELKEKIYTLENKITEYNNALQCKHQILTQTHRVRHSKSDNLTIAKCSKCNIEFEIG